MTMSAQPLGTAAPEPGPADASVTPPVSPGVAANDSPSRMPTAASSRHRRGESRAGVRSGHGPALPTLMIGGALVFWLGFQTWQLVVERDLLQQAYGTQTRTVENASQFRTRLDRIARETQVLADKGNPNAKLLVEELRKRGITINTEPAKDRVPAGK